MNPVSPKVAAAAGSAGATTPLGVIVVWLIGLTGTQVPPDVAIAIGALLASGAAFVGGYLTPHQPPAPVP